MPIQKKLFFIVLLFSFRAMSQATEGKNMLKLNLSAFVFKGAGLQYERQVSRKVTVALGYGLIPVSSVPFTGYIKKQVYISNVNISDYRAGSSVITPEVRYYFSRKGAFHGFYLAPYGRVGFYKIAGPITYSNASGEIQRADFSGKFTSITGGLLLGSNWQLSNKFYLDLWILGASFGGENGNFKATAALTTDERESLRRNLSSISLAGVKLTSDVNNNGATVKTTGSMIGVRGLGINFGIRF